MLTSLVLKMLHSNTGRKPVPISLQLFRSKIQSVARHTVVFTRFSVLLLCVFFPFLRRQKFLLTRRDCGERCPSTAAPRTAPNEQFQGEQSAIKQTKTFLMGRISKLGEDHPVHTQYVLSARLLLCKVSSPKLRIKPSNRACYKQPREGELVFNQGKLKGLSLLSQLKQRVTAHRHSLSIHPTKVRKAI